MKKVLVLATAALLITGVSFAGGGDKKCAKGKECCKKEKSCSKDEKKAKTTATTTKA